MLIQLGLQEVKSTLETLVGSVHSRIWEVKPTKVQGLATLVNFRGPSALEHNGILYKCKWKITFPLLQTVFPTTKKETQILLDLYRFYSKHITHLGILF